MLLLKRLFNQIFIKVIRNRERFGQMHLELRGVGNLVGTEQSGQIQNVGYDLFMAMIDEAVQKLKESSFAPK